MATLSSNNPQQETTPTSANKALWGGIAFSLVFTAVIWLVRPLLPQIDFPVDQGASWYLWQLPDPTFATRASAWGGYFLHQAVIWWTIYYAQKNKHKYTNGLHWINIVALGANAVFVVLHLLQTAVWYDGLAQDTSIWSSQGSVIIMLVMVLLMENQRRGLFFGKKIGFLKETGRVARQYHGYIFSWAVIYTFWYHPMESSSGHLIGFLYTFLLMVQGSLMFTRAHVNKYWTTALEVFVLFHGTLVAYFVQQSEVWTMFFFGFAGMFVVTQMYGLGLTKWQRWGFLSAFVLAALWIYNGRWADMNEILRIPFVEYLLVFIMAGIIWTIMKIVGLFQQSGRQEPSGAVPSGD